MSRHLPIVLFVILAATGMFTVYWYFSPTFGETQAVAVSSVGDGFTDLSAPITRDGEAQSVQQRLSQSPGPIRIGLIVGHLGNDSGAVCADGLEEVAVNDNIVRLVAENLQAQNIQVDILEEFDGRLSAYYGTAVISIHADSCTYVNELATGFKIAGSSRTNSTQLAACVEEAYKDATQLAYHANTITPHMTDYHAFRKLPSNVPAIIVETGFMFLDRQLLTTNAHIPAQGLTNGVLCYLAIQR